MDAAGPDPGDLVRLSDEEKNILSPEFGRRAVTLYALVENGMIREPRNDRDLGCRLASTSGPPVRLRRHLLARPACPTTFTGSRSLIDRDRLARLGHPVG
jgi:hypothetical protein